MIGIRTGFRVILTVLALVMSSAVLAGVSTAATGTLVVTPNCAAQNAGIEIAGWDAGVFYNTALLDASGTILFYSGFTGPSITPGGGFGLPPVSVKTWTYVIYAGPTVSPPYDPATRTVLASATFSCPAAGPATFDPDPNTVGSISFYDAAGNQIAGGSTTGPLAVYYKASGPKVGAFAFNLGSMSIATPQDGVPTNAWTTVDQTTSSQNYTTLQTGYPAGLNDAALNVVIKSAATDTSLGLHITNFPNVSTLNPNTYQVRLYTSASATTYYSANIVVSGTTWTQSYPVLSIGEPPTTTLAAVTSPIVVGAGVTTLSASVTPASGTITNGSVQFLDGYTVLGTVAYTGTNPVTITVAATGAGSFAVGTHSITAAYVPSGLGFSGSTSAAQNLVVNPVATLTSIAVGANVSTGVALSPVILSGTITPTAAAGTVVFSEGAVTLGSAPTVAGVASLTVGTLVAGPHTIHAVFTPTDTVTYAGSSGDATAFTLTAPSITPDPQDIQVTVDNGSLILSSPYSPTNKFDLGHMVLDPTGTYLYASKAFGDVSNPANGLTVTDTRNGNFPWTVSAVANNFSDGSGHAIDAKGLGFTAVTPSYIAGNAINSATNAVTPHDVAPNNLTAGNTALGLGATSPIANVAHGDGTVRITGLLELYAPSSTVAGLYSSVLTFTAA
jgi:hypothetical protein